MRRMVFAAVIFCLASVGLRARQTVAPDLNLRIATPTYYSNGTVGGPAAFGWNLHLNQPFTAYAYAGKTLCDSSSAVIDEPESAGYGWRVQVTPLREDSGALVLQVDWQRQWDRGTKLAAGQRGKAQVTLHPGERLMFDYLSVGERALSPDMATEVTAVTGRPGCSAIGMGLEIGLESSRTTSLVETDLWLVQTPANGKEESQHQTVRVQSGTPAPYFFDSVRVPMVITPFDAGAPASAWTFYATLRFAGEVELLSGAGGKIDLNLTIVRTGNRSDGGFVVLPGVADRRDKPFYFFNYADAKAPGPMGSTTFRVTLVPGEVVSLQVPKAAGMGDQFALRVQAREIK